MRGFGILAAALVLLATAPAAARSEPRWVAAWASAQVVPTGDAAIPEADLGDTTLRQVVRITLGGAQVRLRLSNVHGTAPLAIGAVSIARSPLNSAAAVDPATLVRVTFGGEDAAVIPAGAELWSDPVALAVRGGDDLAISLYLPAAPAQVSGHPGSRATTHMVKGNAVLAADLPGAKTAPRWLFIAGVEVAARGGRALVALGDSITDGYGVQPDTNRRWTDVLWRRMAADRRLRSTAVINAGIGGNRLLLDGSGPNALARFERDVLSQPGVSDLVVLEGVNDLGRLTRDGPASPEQHAALVRSAIGALRQIAARARDRGIRVIGATILPFAGSPTYHPGPATEADRQAINAWIRTPGNFDAVIDFDAALRDPAAPDRLRQELDSGDGLHPSLAGYEAMGALVPLDLLAHGR